MEWCVAAESMVGDDPRAIAYAGRIIHFKTHVDTYQEVIEIESYPQTVG